MKVFQKLIKSRLLITTLSIIMVCTLFWFIKHGFDFSLPKTIVALPDMPQAIAVDDTHVYWSIRGQLDENRLWDNDAVAGKIMRANKDGSNVETLASGLYSPWDIAVDSDYVYWIGVDGVKKVLKTGGEVIVVSSIPNNNNSGINGFIYGDFATDGENIYWTNFNSISKMNKVSGVLSELAVGHDARNIEVNSNYIYWLEDQEAIWRANLDGTEEVVLDTGDNVIVDFVVDDSYIYWANSSWSEDSNSIVKMSVEGGPSIIVKKLNFFCFCDPQHLAVDFDYLYWNTDGVLSYPLSYMPKEGGISRTITQNVQVGDLVVDSSGVFFTLPFNQMIIFVEKKYRI